MFILSGKHTYWRVTMWKANWIQDKTFFTSLIKRHSWIQNDWCHKQKYQISVIEGCRGKNVRRHVPEEKMPQKTHPVHLLISRLQFSSALKHYISQFLLCHQNKRKVVSQKNKFIKSISQDLLSVQLMVCFLYIQTSSTSSKHTICHNKCFFLNL